MDDGTFDEENKPKTKDKGFSSYMHNFLDYVTKTYNMFIHMTLKSKILCLIEMACIGVVIGLIDWLAPELIKDLFDRVFRYVPYGYTISSVLSDIFAIALIVLSVIVFLHLFKIRYLDYYVTIVDNTIDEQVVESPIEENSNMSALDNKQKKEKVVIRDPKHSISHFLDGIAKIISFIFKLFVIICALPALVCTVGAIYLAVIMYANIASSSIFTFAGVCLTGCAVFGFIFIYMAVNYIFKKKQPYVVILILFLVSILAIGTGAGLATNQALNLDVVNDDYKIEYSTLEYAYTKEEVGEGIQFEFNCYKIERVIDENVEGVIVQIQLPDNARMTSDEYRTESPNIKGVFFNFGYAKGLYHELYKIKDDIKNGYIRESYEGPYSMVKVDVIMSQETSDKVEIIYW